MPDALDLHRLSGTDNTGWTQYRDADTSIIYNPGYREIYRKSPQVYSVSGLLREGISGIPGRVFQIDFQATGQLGSSLQNVMGLRLDGMFLVTPDIIYGYLHGTPSGLAVQTFPSGDFLPVNIYEWYTLKLRLTTAPTDYVEVILHGGSQNYNNQVIGSGELIDSSIGAPVYFILDTSAMNENSPVRFRNFAISDSLSYVVPEISANMTNQDWSMREFYR